MFKVYIINDYLLFYDLLFIFPLENEARILPSSFFPQMNTLYHEKSLEKVKHDHSVRNPYPELSKAGPGNN